MRLTTDPPEKTTGLQILVADSTPMGCQLLSHALRRCRSFDVFGVSSHCDLLKTVACRSPQVAVISVDLDGEPLRGLRVTREVRTAHHGTKVILLLDSSKKDLVVGAFRAGASGVFCRADSISLLPKCIQAVYKGQVWASPSELWFLLDTLSESLPLKLVDAKGAELLSSRELDVVRCASEGLSNREIAFQLKLSEHTVKNYLFRIFDKLGVSNRIEMLLYVFSQGGNPLHPAPLNGKNGADSGDSNTSLEAYQKEAEKGSDLSQLILGRMYSRGHGVARDLLASYAWLHLAEVTNKFLSRKIKQEKYRIAKNMLAQQIQQAEQQASVWLSEHPCHLMPLPAQSRPRKIRARDATREQEPMAIPVSPARIADGSSAV